jgi:hypothetical protein
MADERGRGKPRRKGARPGRRTPPPESTGREAGYLFRLREKQIPVVVRLVNDSTVEGVIEYYDRDMVKVVPREGPGFFIRKKDIRYLYAEDE